MDIVALELLMLRVFGSGDFEEMVVIRGFEAKD